MISAAIQTTGRLRSRAKELAPGVMLAALVAMAAQFVSEHSEAPAMLMALLFGMALNFMSEEGESAGPGIVFSSKALLKIGIVLLGARISTDILFVVGWQTLCLVIAGLFATMGFGLIIGRLLNRSTRFAVLTAGAVSICGASAALAINSVLPSSKISERQLLVTILGVTALSTAAMIIYPALMSSFGATDEQAAIFIGATIHDVAQVVGAGYSMSDPVGELSTFVKLMRVTLLAPTVIIIALMFRKQRAEGQAATGGFTQIIPAFVVGFLLFAAGNSCGLLPQGFVDLSGQLSRVLLLTAIAAVGINTKLKELTSLGYATLALIVAETLFLASFAGAVIFAFQAV